MLVIAFASACAPRTVFVEEHGGTVARVGRQTRGHLWVRINGEWTETQVTTLPEGWYLVPPSYVAEDEP